MPQGDNDDEIWDVYDRERNLTGQTHRRGDPLAPGEYHLVVHICIFNSQGKVLIQQRQPWKKGWPGLWDISTGGSAIAGDDSRRAAEREVLEELGLPLDLSQEQVRFTFHWKNGFDDYWMVRRDVELDQLHLQYEEVAAVRWVDRAELQTLIDAGQFVPYFFADRIFDIYMNTDDYNRSDVQIGHTYFIRKSAEKAEVQMQDRFLYQVIPVLREYHNDGILMDEFYGNEPEAFEIPAFDIIEKMEKCSDSKELGKLYNQLLEELGKAEYTESIKKELIENSLIEE